MWLWHLQELTLYAGIVPIAALIILLVARARLAPRIQQHLAATVSLLVWSTLAVAMFASRFASDRIQDRYLFFLVPLLVIVLLAWVEVGAPRPRVATSLAVVVALGLPLLFPFSRFISEPAKSDTLGLLPLWTINEHLVLGRVLGDRRARRARSRARLPPRACEGGGRSAARGPALLRRRLEACLVRAARVSRRRSRGALSGDQGRRPRLDRSCRSRRAGGRRAVDGTGGSVHREPERVLQPARRQDLLHRRPDARGCQRDAGLARPGCRCPRASGGVFVLPTDGVVDAPYALLDGSITPDGVVVARDEELGTTLWRLTGPLSSRTTVTGIYDGRELVGSHRDLAAAALPAGDPDDRRALRSEPLRRPPRRSSPSAAIAGRPCASPPTSARRSRSVSRPTSGERASSASS